MSGNIFLNPGLVIRDHEEHRVSEVLPVEVHSADEVVLVDAAVAETRLVLDMVRPPYVDPDNVQ